jgi:hypothetical protein
MRLLRCLGRVAALALDVFDVTDQVRFGVIEALDAKALLAERDVVPNMYGSAGPPTSSPDWISTTPNGAFSSTQRPIISL